MQQKGDCGYLKMRVNGTESKGEREGKVVADRTKNEELSQAQSNQSKRTSSE